MSKSWQLRSLMKKNLILMKRSWAISICELFFPILLMFFLVLIRNLIEKDVYKYDFSDEDYLAASSSAIINPNQFPNLNMSGKFPTWNGLTFRTPFSKCNVTGRHHIGAIGNDINKELINNKISSLYDQSIFINFSTIDEFNNYITDIKYGKEGNPEVCFGYYFSQIDNSNFNYSLHFSDDFLGNKYKDTPSTLIPALDPFKSGPDMQSYKLWLESGFLHIMRIINEVILNISSEKVDAEISFGMMAQKYSSYTIDQFSQFIGFILPFFLVIAYLCPLCILVFRMVQEKESRAKEGMKIMGLNEGIYFLSFFLQWLITNTIYSILNSFILTYVLSYIHFRYIFLFFWLYGMTIFALAYFLQSLMDKTRVAMILTVLLYFVMFFIAEALVEQDIANLIKMLISLLPPSALGFGILTLSKFEANQVEFDGSKLNIMNNNYSVFNMYIMFLIDTLLYTFLGYYLQNVLPHQFGLKKPFYFLCTKSYWCKGKRSKNYTKRFSSIEENDDKYKENFLSEKNYEDKLQSGDCLQIINLKKRFDDGKIAVDGLNLNIYKGEIFALLGHNGAGKSTTISILSGLYEATSGVALYNNENILEGEEMEEFRKSLGICPQNDILFANLTIKEHLEMFCIFKGVSGDKIDQEVQSTITKLQIEDKADDLAGNLSGGQKRKLSIAIALIGGSQIVFLDEPSSGMDITARRHLWEILKQCVEDKIIVLTTHYMEEAAVLGNRIGIMSNGKLKCCGNTLFLIEKFGKYLSLTICKYPDANDEEIINYVKEKYSSAEVQILSEEIIFKIPKINNDLSFKNFFSDFDEKLNDLKIKSYGVSMPTLEDVFINVSSESNISNMRMTKSFENKIVNDFIEFDISKEKLNKGFEKIMGDLISSVKKRLLNIIRDKKSFVLEILCPILLVLIGVLISSIKFFKDSPKANISINSLPVSETIFFNEKMYNNKTIPNYFLSLKEDYINYTYIDLNISNYSTENLVNYNNELYSKDITSNSFGSYLIMDYPTPNPSNPNYLFTTFVNTQARFSAVIYTQHMMNKIVSYSAMKPININAVFEPFPLTNEVLSQGRSRNNSNLIFFLSIAFALIPANFITIIIKERETNTKHLQIISGISLFSYWLSNFIFELIKYYFIGGICMLIIFAYNSLADYFWIIYLLYGPSMISFTYIFSFVFKTESSAQNSVILINFFFGTLGGNIIMVFRILDSLKSIGQSLSYALRIFPTFAFTYGTFQLLSKDLLETIDNKIEGLDLLSLEYSGMDMLYLGVSFVIFLITLITIETFTCRLKKENNNKVNKKAESANKINDSNILKEILRLDEENHEPEENTFKQFSIRVKNLVKEYSLGLCSKKVKAVDGITFGLEYGECFALLGVNGAGKTTTFKCLTNELTASSGEIFINNFEVTSNFENVRSLIGYCPQFDAIFEYMTVYENLDFYARIKGIPEKIREKVIDSLITEMNLVVYKDKISGNLSGGNKRKLSVAIAMIGNPPIVLLDEPSTGMDPEARRFMWEVIHKISTRSKLSSVILTTHSMEEAETLCRRIGILVDGKFRCLGTSQQIKDKFGFGYEVHLSFKIPTEEDTNSFINLSNLQFSDRINESNIGNFLHVVNKSQLYSQISRNKLGHEIFEDIIRNPISAKKVIDWIYYTELCLKMSSVLLDYFNEIYIIQFYGNNIKFKINKNSETLNPTIGFLFGLLEDQKYGFVSEFSVSQTSLEQIFNQFAFEKETVSSDFKKEEILITKELINELSNIY